MKRDSDTPYDQGPVPPPTSPPAHCAAYVPPPKPTWPRGVPRPARVKIWITPVTASEPYSTLTGPRTISIRSMSAVVRFAKSKEPPGKFCGTPSISTFT